MVVTIFSLDRLIFIDKYIVSIFSNELMELACDIVVVEDRNVANVQQNYVLRKIFYEVLSLYGV